MPHFDIIKRNKPVESFRVKTVMGTYDLQDNNVQEHFIGDIDLPKKWNIGLIVGRSGTGKTTIAKELFGEHIISSYEYTHDNILDDMPAHVSTNEVFATLSKVGFSSPPSWLKPYNVLSNGEKMRCDLARAILENKDMFVFDEFTSVVDRNVAKIGSLAMQKIIRKNDKKFIAVTCHYDVQEWLMPDWIFNTDTMKFQTIDVETQKKNKPRLELKFYETDRKEYFWNMFRRYHYLSHAINKASHVYLCTYNDNICAICATLPFPHPIAKNVWKIHRTVVLPDYQGVGIGTAFNSWVGEYYKSKNKRLSIVTSNASMIYALKRSDKWICKRIGRLVSTSTTGKLHNKFKQEKTSSDRITASFMYKYD